MAGSFDLFRKYQRSMLAGVAILAMLAFFVLPPFLQMAPDAGATDPLVATWNGGGIREGELRRQVAMGMVVNQFLRDAIGTATGRDPGDVRVLGEDEESVVRTLLLAREAEANGIVVGNAAVNRFLAQVTDDRLRGAEIEALLAGRRLGNTSVSTLDVFAALRTFLAASQMRQFVANGLGGYPPGARWDLFRRLEQQATIEVVPIAVESFATEVPAPAEADLRGFFDRHKDSLPVDRSPEPGFMEPHRISYDWIVAARDTLEAAAAREVTDAEIEKFYEENKVRLYRAKPAPQQPAAEKPADPPVEKKPDAAPAADPAQPPAGEPQSAVPGHRRVVAAKFRRTDAGAAADVPAAPAAATEGKAAPTAPPAQADPPAKAEPPAKGEQSTQAPAPASNSASAAAEFESLDAVRDDVRKRLATEAVSRRLDALFKAITTDVGGYARDLARWKADAGAAADRPTPPSAAAIAEKQGLQAGHADKRTAAEAVRDGGVGGSFQVALDPRSPMGFRQTRWTDLFFAADRPLWRPVETSGVTGDRYLAWKTEDAPAFVPEFAAVRADVERAWRIIEARPLARKAAEEIAAKSGGRPLAEALADLGRAKLEVVAVEPFTWLSRGASFGAPATLSQPTGVEMPGEEFMQAVFALEPGGTAVAFNAPRTVCYVIRLVSSAPPEAELRGRFLDPAADQRRLEAVAEQDRERALAGWLDDVERRAGLEWKQPPQGR